MLFLQLLILVILFLICWQDMVSRSVYWILFPVLTALLIGLRLLSHEPVADIWRSALVNTGFLALQLLLVTAYFSLKKGRWVNLTAQLLGWGDILFLVSVALYLPLPDFLVFYIVSLLAIIAGWFIWLRILPQKGRTVPLAGLQAFLLLLFLSAGWWYPPFHLTLTGDSWLLPILSR